MLCSAAMIAASMSAATPAVPGAVEGVEGKIGLILALYNANTTTDWPTVAAAAKRIPIRAIVPVGRGAGCGRVHARGGGGGGGGGVRPTQ